MMSQLNQLALGGSVQKIHYKKGGRQAKSGSYLFSYRLISVNNRTRKQRKRLIILKEGAE